MLESRLTFKAFDMKRRFQSDVAYTQTSQTLTVPTAVPADRTNKSAMRFRD